MKNIFRTGFSRSILAIALLFSTQMSHAAPLSRQRVNEIVAIYKSLLHLTVATPRTASQSLFSQPETLTHAQIHIAGNELGALLNETEMPESVARILLFNQLSQGTTPDLRAKLSLLKELDTIDQLFQNQLDDYDEKQKRWSLFLQSITSIGLSTAGSLIAHIHSPTLEESQTWFWPVVGGMIGGGVLGVAQAQFRMFHWIPENYWTTQSWTQQFQKLGNRLDPIVRDRIENTIASFVFRMDSDIFPPIPHYTHLLNWASSQPNLGPINVLDEAIHERAADLENLAPNPNHVIVEMGDPNPPAAPATHTPHNASVRILEDFHSLDFSDQTLNRLSATEFRAAVKALSHEMKNQPHALWSHLASRRILFLALHRKDAEALYEILKSRIGIMMPVMYPRYTSFYNRAFLIAVRNNHARLTQLLISPRSNPTMDIGTRLILEVSTLNQAERIATQNGLTEIQALLQARNRPNRAPRAARGGAARIMPNAGHDGENLTALNATIRDLRNRYRSELARLKSSGASAPSVREQIEDRLKQLRKSSRITDLQDLAARALLDRIDAPFNRQSPDYDAGHIFLWNTDEKKTATRELLQLAVVALEDPTAFRQQNNRSLTSSDRDDNWVSWINNALVDSAHAYAIDGGRSIDLERIASASSCVPGVDHRIIHGLTGLHPDVKLGGGDTEADNLRVWQTAIQAAKKDRRARFYQSVFNTLIESWVQSGAVTSGDSEQNLLNYKQFVTTQAQNEFGEETLAESEFKTILETIDDYPEQILEKIQQALSQAA